MHSCLNALKQATVGDIHLEISTQDFLATFCYTSVQVFVNNGDHLDISGGGQRKFEKKKLEEASDRLA